MNQRGVCSGKEEEKKKGVGSGSGVGSKGEFVSGGLRPAVIPRESNIPAARERKSPWKKKSSVRFTIITFSYKLKVAVSRVTAFKRNSTIGSVDLSGQKC